MKEDFLKNLIATKKTKTPMLQVLLLGNDAGNDVEVQEAEQGGFLPSAKTPEKRRFSLYHKQSLAKATLPQSKS